MSNKFFLKNYPSDDVLSKKLIQDFIKRKKEYKKNDLLIFYKYTAETKYFIDNLPDSGGFSSEDLVNIEDQELAFFSISKCKADTTKFVGKYHYYGINHNLDQTDTLIYRCQYIQNNR
ncbi:hypothetical protein GCM10022423_20840 [Flavobacterium ginsengiterrae]|uniref:Immunity protein 22 of polymorphic toxin system n=2 Tax=Flavobacterium ginsengiterrae TaxID=871695 RepID=A0ABP7GK78_9FLAO